MPVDLADYYARRAAEYEAVYLKPERQRDLERLRGLVVAQMAGRTVLEVACGTGYWTSIAAAAAVRVVAMDAVREVLENARRKAFDPAVVSLVQADAWQVPVRPGRIDSVFAGFWWSHLRRPELGGFLGRLREGVGPGTRCVFIDNRYVPGSSTPISRQDDEGNTYQLRSLADGSVHEVLKNFPSREELGTTAAGVGWDVAVEWLDYYWMLSFTTT